MAKQRRFKMTKKQALAYVEDWLAHYQNDERVLEMRRFPHHPPISAYVHCIRVVRKCVDVVCRLHIAVDWNGLLLAAILHDFYLYDFREMSSFRNGIIHPLKAAENAKKLFNVDPWIERAIRTHMFPTVFWRIPNCREAWILSWADKLVATREMIRKK